MNIHTWNLKAIPALLLLTLLVGLLPAQQAGDYRTKWAWGTFSDANIWEVHNGSAWVSAHDAPASPFLGTLYMNHTLVLDRSLTISNRLLMAPGARLEMVNGSKLEITADAYVALNEVMVNAGARLENYGSIVSIPNGGNITLQYQATNAQPAVLLNMASIVLNDDNQSWTYSLDMCDRAVLISGENASISGTGSFKTTDQHVRFEIANQGGLDEAVSLSGYRYVGPAHYLFNGTQPQVTGQLGERNFSITIANPSSVSLQHNVSLNPWENATVRVMPGAKLRLQDYVIISSDWGNASFHLDTGATVSTAHPDGISSEEVNQRIYIGAIQTNQSSYSSQANYVFDGTTIQQSGNFVTEPDPNTVNNLIVNNTAGLVLTNPITVTGTVQGAQNIQGDYTLPITLSSFTAVPMRGKSVRIQWVTASETNVLGYYILRSMEPKLESALRISPLLEAVNSSQGSMYQFTDRDLHGEGTYYYWLEDIGFSSAGDIHGPLQVHILPGHTSQNSTPAVKPGFSGSFPNPFNPSTTLRFSLPESGNAVLNFYNQKGQLVDQIDLSNRAKGEHQVVWNTQNLNLPSGTYFAKLVGDGFQDIKKISLSK